MVFVGGVPVLGPSLEVLLGENFQHGLLSFQSSAVCLKLIAQHFEKLAQFEKYDLLGSSHSSN